jgi:GH24 family phage-related lysozyme (muramidase)
MDTNLKKVLVGAAGAIAVSAAGLGFIGNWEGKENDPYRDIAGVWTVCYGSTGAHVVPGGRRTDAECLSLLEEDVVRFEAAVNRCTPVPKTQNQFDALVSISYNIGERAYCSSTLVRKFNAGDTLGAADQFPAWSYATVNGEKRQIRGLLNRRLAERVLFLTPPPAAPVGAPRPAPVSPSPECPDAPERPGNRG